MNLEYIRATTKDIPLLLNIEHSVANLGEYSAELDAEDWEESMRNGVVYLLSTEGDLVGDITYEMKSPAHAYIGGIVIMPRYQGRGFSRQAMQHILDEILPVKRIDLVTHPDNFKAIKLYASFGFKIESKIDNYYDDGEPRVVMSLIQN